MTPAEPGMGRISKFCTCELPAPGRSHSMGVTYLQVRVGTGPAGSTHAGSELPLRHSFFAASSRIGGWAHLPVLVLRSCWLGKLSALHRWDPQLQSTSVCAGCLRVFTEDDLCLSNKSSNCNVFNVLGIEGKNHTYLPKHVSLYTQSSSELQQFESVTTWQETLIHFSV